MLLLGESGTGKELVAQALHQNSPRRAKPFVRVACASLPETLLESELFGHEKGSFTGALYSRAGRFEAADGGTLFLDEIGDISPTVQVKLLRFLEEREFERVGGNRTYKVDVRIVAATHRDLKRKLEDGTFRDDLYYRLNVIEVTIPPLRERGGDIPLLAQHFLGKYAAANGKSLTLSDEALALLLQHRWPGNVRELENAIERAVVLADSGVLSPVPLPDAAPRARARAARGAALTGGVADPRQHARDRSSARRSCARSRPWAAAPPGRRRCSTSARARSSTSSRNTSRRRGDRASWATGAQRARPLGRRSAKTSPPRAHPEPASDGLPAGARRATGWIRDRHGTHGSRDHEPGALQRPARTTPSRTRSTASWRWRSAAPPSWTRSGGRSARCRSGTSWAGARAIAWPTA